MPLDGPRLAALKIATQPDLRVEVVAVAESTNAILTQRGRGGAAEGLVVVAEHQTAGRGRLDRVWESPAGSALTFSVLLRPTVSPASWPWLPLLAGHALADTLAAQGYAARVKWPNDVLLGSGAEERKVAGILVERVETADGPAAVVGIGINVGMTAAELPVPEATSLALARPEATPDRTEILELVVTRLLAEYAEWQSGGSAAAARLRTAYAAACATLGREVVVSLPGGADLTGTAESIDEQGRLLVVNRAGERVPVGAGDVVHVRDARSDG